MIPRASGTLLLLATLLLTASAVAHGLVNLNVVVPAECPGNQTGCLTTIDNQPPLHAGGTVSFFAYNDAAENHTLHVVSNVSRGAGGPPAPSQALASTGSIPSNGSRDAGEFTIPTEARALYVWCSNPGHASSGERLVFPLEAPPPEDHGSSDASLGSWMAAATLASVAFVVRARR